MRFNKKAQGEFVAYVLLIGLAVTLAVIVGRWSIEQAQKSSESVANQGEIEEKCTGIALSGFVDCSTGNPKAKITNRGAFTINKLKIQGDGGCAQDITVNLKPNAETTQALNNCNVANIIPITTIKESEIGCSEKKLVLNLLCPS